MSMYGLPDEHINSYDTRFREGPSFVDMSDKIMDLEKKLREVRSPRSENEVAQDFMDCVYYVAERNQWFDTVPDGFLDEVASVVGRTFDITSHEAMLTFRAERDLLRRQRDQLLSLCDVGFSVDGDGVRAAFLTDPAERPEADCA